VQFETNSPGISQHAYSTDVEVPSPGIINDQSIAGIDTDSDGVRDDVQQWINFESKNNRDLKTILKSMARNWQSMIADSTNETLIISQKTKNQTLKNCMYGIIENDEYSANIEGLMKYAYFNTEDRMNACVGNL
jgi:hypothetical protein